MGDYAENLCLSPGTSLTGTLKSYSIVKVLGQGGFGITYEATSQLGERVAIKEYFPLTWIMRTADRQVVPKTDAERSYQKGLQSFSKEARMLAGINDLDTVVKVMDCFHENGTAYLVMEFLDGMSLKAKAEACGGRIPAEELLPKLRPVIADIEKLHQRDVLHRDIAPDNLIWTTDDKIKLIDFGAARRMEENRQLTVMAKPGFAPVEQYTSGGQGTWTDVYALCATMYYLLTGKMPTPAPDRLYEENSGLLSPISLGVGITQQEEQAIMHGMAVQPKQRTRTMGELLTELGDVVEPIIIGGNTPTMPAPIPEPTFFQRLTDRIMAFIQRLANR